MNERLRFVTLGMNSIRRLNPSLVKLFFTNFKPFIFFNGFTYFRTSTISPSDKEYPVKSRVSKLSLWINYSTIFSTVLLFGSKVWGDFPTFLLSTVLLSFFSLEELFPWGVVCLFLLSEPLLLDHTDSVFKTSKDSAELNYNLTLGDSYRFWGGDSYNYDFGWITSCFSWVITSISSVSSYTERKLKIELLTYLFSDVLTPPINFSIIDKSDFIFFYTSINIS